MATLVSPGVSVSVIDESMYAGRGPGTVPLIVLATASNKRTPDGSEIAEGTLPENSGTAYLITSQRELLQTFGDPTFINVSGVAQHGNPINEYGLLAAHSYLGIANRAYVVRANIDTDQLRPTSIEPTSNPPVGTIWLDTDDTQYGLHILVADPDDSSAVAWSPVEITYSFIGSSDNAIGNNGDYAVVINEASGVINYRVKVSGEWESLYTPINPNTSVGSKVISSKVYPAFDNIGDLLDADDIGYAYWVKTTPGNNGAHLDIRIMQSNGEFMPSDVPMITVNQASPSGIFDADDEAEEYFDNDPDEGNIYARAYFGDSSTNSSSRIELVYYVAGSWLPLTTIIANETRPSVGPSDGTYWYNSSVGLQGNAVSTVDILINNGQGSWENITLPGSTNTEGDLSTETAFAQALDPAEDSTVSVSNGDIWIDTTNMDEYPAIYRRKANKWVRVVLSDQVTSNGILFADARPAPNYSVGSSAAGYNNGGGTAPDLDMDAPDPDAYPKGMLLWNTRYSTRNVKRFVSQHPVYVDSNDELVLAGRWINESGNDIDGTPFMGSRAQRAVIVKEMSSVVSSSEDLRSETLMYNLIAAPGFPEMISTLNALNIDRKETGFVIGDTPFNLRPVGTDIQIWATNSNNASGDGERGIITSTPYLSVNYPSCGLTRNIDGNNVVVPSSHMALRTYAYNDQVAYQWFAPAGDQRGRISNADSVGYITSDGEFRTVVLSQGIKDVLYLNNINPIETIPNRGIQFMGQKTRNPFESALDRVNVARLVNYIRERASIIARPFLFEPNDRTTRDNIKDVFDRFLGELVTLRGLEDFVVVCDTTNNTPIRIDRNELWIDISIIPVKSVEFIYIPIRIRNTGSDL